MKPPVPGCGNQVPDFRFPVPVAASRRSGRRFTLHTGLALTGRTDSMAAMSLQSHGSHRSPSARRSPSRIVHASMVGLTGLAVAGAGIGIASSAGASPEAPAPAVSTTKVQDLSGAAGVALAAGVSPETVATLTANPEATYAAALNYGVPASTIDWVLANPGAALGAAQAAGIDVVWAANTLAAAV